MSTQMLEGPPPITLTAYTGGFVRRGPVTGATRVEILARYNGPRAVVFEVDDDNPRIDDLLAPDARVVATYTPPHGGRPLTVSGPVEEYAGEDDGTGTRTFTVNGDFSVFAEILAWPAPTRPITQQGDEGAYHTAKGPAETVLKTVTSLNASRQGVALTIPASQGRGPTITVTNRMHLLADRLIPAVDLAGLGVDVVQTGAAPPELRVWQPRTHTRVLTQESGAIISGSFSHRRATITRVVVGAGGEGVARKFIEVVDHDAEAAGRRQRAAFVDARDIDPTDPAVDHVALMTARATKSLADAGARTSLSVELAETEAWSFGSAFDLGDVLPVRLTGAPVITDRVREVEITWTATEGLDVVPRIGQWADNETSDLYRLVARLAATQRDQGTR